MSVQIGDQYIEKNGGAILTVVKVLIAEDAINGLLEYVVLDNNEDRAILFHKLKQLCVKVVQSETGPVPFAAVKAAYPEAKWIAMDRNGNAFAYLRRPRLDNLEWANDYHEINAIYIFPSEFPEAYAHFENIPWNESLTEL